jgi:EmrB/QacA subfamily drug resistance transporter
MTSSASSSPSSPASPHGSDNPRRWWALAALALSVLGLGFAITILNVALPTMAADLDASTTEQLWIVDSFLVVFASTMLPAGLLGDRFGRRRMLIVGLAILFAGSVAGALVDSAGPLIAARAVMGLGAALIAPLALSVLPTLFSPEERGKAVAALGSALAAGLPLGPLLGGWLLDHFWWGSIFLIQLPLAAVGIIACLLLVPESRDPAAPRVDALSATLSVVGLAALVFGVIEGPNQGWNDPLVLVALIGSVPLLTALVMRERSQPHPMLSFDLLRERGFAWSTLIATMVSLILTGLLFVVPQYLQAVRGEDAMATGVQLMPMMGGLLVGARACDPLAKAFGARPIIVIGLGLLAVAGVIGGTTEADSGYGLAALWLTITGLGTGLALILAMNAALEHLPTERAGVGSGLLMTARQVGSAIGVALIGSLLTQVYQNRLETGGLPEAAADVAGDSVVAGHLVADELGGPAGADLADSASTAFVDGMSLTLFVCAAMALATALLAARLLPRAARRPGSEPGGPAVDKAAADTGLATSESDRRE